MTDDDHPLLRTRGLGVVFPDGHRALGGVSVDIERGELIAVIGPNGAGKSTLFRAITGLITHEGTVTMCGVHCHHQRDRLDAAYIPQRNDLDRDFPITVGQVVLDGRRRFRRRPSAADRSAAADALARVGLEGLDGRPLGRLSGGQFQRVLLARSLAQEAHLILLDEALSGVDQPRTEALLDLFDELTADGVALLVATHDLSLAKRRFRRCLAVNGRLTADGPPDAVLSGDVLAETFQAVSTR